MEKNTVVLDLNDYLELKEFKEKIEKDYIQVSTYGYYNSNIDYLTKDETIIKLGKEIENLKKESDDLQGQGIDLTRKLEQIRINSLDLKAKIKHLSIWEFIKYRKNKLEL